MNDEKTIYDDEKVQYQSQEQEIKQDVEKAEPTAEAKKVPVKKPMWQRAAIGLGTGFAAGVATTILTSGTTQAQAQEQEQNENDNGNNTTGGTAHPTWVDGEVNVAMSVNDSMSFGEAFEAARSEVGAGGVFEWHGGIYNTYYEDEWNNMSAADRAEFGSHFSWNDHHNDVTANHPSSNHVAATVVEQPTGDETGENDVVITAVEQPDGDEDVLQLTGGDHEVEILGVVHDNESGTNIGGLMIDGHEAVVLDMNNDMEFNILGIDLNDNHEFEQGERMDISDMGLTVDDLGGLQETQIEQTSDDYNVDEGPYEC